MLHQWRLPSTLPRQPQQQTGVELFSVVTADVFDESSDVSVVRSIVVFGGDWDGESVKGPEDGESVNGPEDGESVKGPKGGTIVGFVGSSLANSKARSAPSSKDRLSTGSKITKSWFEITGPERMNYSKALGWMDQRAAHQAHWWIDQKNHSSSLRSNRCRSPNPNLVKLFGKRSHNCCIQSPTPRHQCQKKAGHSFRSCLI